MRLPRIHADTTALRESRELRSLVLGNFVSGMGTQASLVALPYQLYVPTKSPLLTGLLGAAELVPLIVMALLGGALADRLDRRRLLLVDQVALCSLPAGCAELRWRVSLRSGCSTSSPGCSRASARSRTSRARRSCRTWSSPRGCTRPWRSTSGCTS
jgi:MFS family permease